VPLRYPSMSPGTSRVAALYVAKGGAYYFGLDGVDPWAGGARRAGRTPGRDPVVAHPPCQLWVNFAALNFKRYGGEHNRPGNDGGCFDSAVSSVVRWGGVLEHPASSNAWGKHGLPTPNPAGGWNSGRLQTHGYPKVWVCEVWQSAYGHPARKRTWLMWHRPGWPDQPPELDWSHPTGTHQVGWFDRIKPTLSKKAASATPPEFRDAMLMLARSAA
jgi:hypothetical protein